MCKKSIKNSQPFVRKMRNIRTPQGGGFFWTHTVDLYVLKKSTHTASESCTEIINMQRKHYYCLGPEIKYFPISLGASVLHKEHSRSWPQCETVLWNTVSSIFQYQVAWFNIHNNIVSMTSLLHDELHWLDVPERVTYKMGVMVYRCLHGQAPQ